MEYNWKQNSADESKVSDTVSSINHEDTHAIIFHESAGVVDSGNILVACPDTHVYSVEKTFVSFTKVKMNYSGTFVEYNWKALSWS